jgi:hypothetical protein
MLMGLADGKHFRAGIERRKRVALFFLDDATRFGLGVAVDSSENTEVFLAGLHVTVSRHGLLNSLYLDHGPGFISRETYDVMQKLSIGLIHGEKAYPEGHGKIERFNQTFKYKLLRSFDGNPTVDPDCGALKLRLTHALEEVYNHTPHESLDRETPAQRWHRDPRPLVAPRDPEWLRSCFRLTEIRTVTTDNVVPYDGAHYEIPRGYAGQRIEIVRLMLEPGVLCIRHHGSLVQIHPVDLAANANARRGTPRPSQAPPDRPPPETAAKRLFDQRFQPVVDPDGGFSLEGSDDDQDH